MVAKLPSQDFIYLITGVEFILFDKFKTTYHDLQNIEVVRTIEGTKRLLQEQGFYYSYHADITSSQQRQASVKFQYSPGRNNSYSFREEFLDTRYMWNNKIIEDFKLQNIDPFWTVPIIQGFVDQTTKRFGGNDIDVMLISRRRHAMAGTRFISRGIDDNSNVANFVESEIIITYD